MIAIEVPAGPRRIDVVGRLSLVYRTSAAPGVHRYPQVPDGRRGFIEVQRVLWHAAAIVAYTTRSPSPRRSLIYTCTRAHSARPHSRGPAGTRLTRQNRRPA